MSKVAIIGAGAWGTSLALICNEKGHEVKLWAFEKELVEQNPWIAKAIFDAYSTAKMLDYKFMMKIGWAYDSLPWYRQELEETMKLMGKNFWPYGIEPNRKTLETLFRYSYEQGLSSRELTIEELFHPSSLKLKEN